MNRDTSKEGIRKLLPIAQPTGAIAQTQALRLAGR
jgi:hypothetical protein